ncbi:MAG: hypothetical protein M3R61_10025 [Chloroflexota bacterium]|nr:hypothetical protein [Chloroflexota bacterium]
MDEEEIVSIRRVLTAHMRRLVILQERQAAIGRRKEPELDIEIEDIEKVVQQLKEQISSPNIVLTPIEAMKLLSVLEILVKNNQLTVNTVAELTDITKTLTAEFRSVDRLLNRLITVVEHIQEDEGAIIKQQEAMIESEKILIGNEKTLIENGRSIIDLWKIVTALVDFTMRSIDAPLPQALIDMTERYSEKKDDL